MSETSSESPAGKPFKFIELFADSASRNEVVATFLAMLEMIRLRQIVITQDDVFSEIMISEGVGEDGLEASAPWAKDSEPATD